MKKVLFTILFLGAIGFAAVVYADNFMGSGIYSNASASAGAVSGTYAPCPYTSTIPNNASAPNTTTYSAPSYPVYPGPTYNTYNSAPSYTTSYYNSPSPYAAYANPTIYCPRGYQPDASLSSCVTVQIPPHAHLSLWGTTYDCDIGYHSFGNSCVPDQYTAGY